MEHRLGTRARISAEVFERHPDYRAHIIYTKGVVNGPSSDTTLQFLRSSQEQAMRRFAQLPITEHPHIAAWRTTYGQFGSKPSRFHCSAEALLRRAVKGVVPSVNRLVDVYNAVSLAHVVPIGGEDCDQVRGDPVLRFAGGGESFETYEGGRLTTVPADPGEVIWVDDGGVTCRRWNWRQCERTTLVEHSVNAYFILDALGPCTDAELGSATQALVEGLRCVSPGFDMEAVMISRASKDSGEPLTTIQETADNGASLGNTIPIERG